MEFLLFLTFFKNIILHKTSFYVHPNGKIFFGNKKEKFLDHFAIGFKKIASIVS